MVLGIFFFIIMMITGVYAITIQTTSTAISTGTVDIEIKNYKLNDENNEVEFENTEILYPGSTTSYIPKVVNWGDDCYLRIKVNYIDNGTNFEDYVTGFSNKFTRNGEYYYYDGVVRSGEIIKLFDTITIPSDIQNSAADKDVIIKIYAEAVQERNFEPDYSSNSPWGDIVPTANAQNTINVDVDDEMTIVIRYQDTSANDIQIKDNFLERLKNLMPGDSFSDSMVIKNNNSERIKYYLEINTEEKNELEKRLLEQIALKVTSENGDVIYNGKLLLDNKLFLKEIEPGEENKFEFAVSVPNELSNEYTRLNPNLILTFSDNHNEKPHSGVPTGGNQGSTGNQVVGTIAKLIDLPRTGDRVDVVITIFILASIGFVITIILDYRERKILSNKK